MLTYSWSFQGDVCLDAVKSVTQSEQLVPSSPLYMSVRAPRPPLRAVVKGTVCSHQLLSPCCAGCWCDLLLLLQLFVLWWTLPPSSPASDPFSAFVNRFCRFNREMRACTLTAVSDLLWHKVFLADPCCDHHIRSLRLTHVVTVALGSYAWPILWLMV